MIYGLDPFGHHFFVKSLIGGDREPVPGNVENFRALVPCAHSLWCGYSWLFAKLPSVDDTNSFHCLLFLMSYFPEKKSEKILYSSRPPHQPPTSVSYLGCCGSCRCCHSDDGGGPVWPGRPSRDKPGPKTASNNIPFFFLPSRQSEIYHTKKISSAARPRDHQSGLDKNHRHLGSLSLASSEFTAIFLFNAGMITV